MSIKDRRKALALSRQELAERAGIDKGVLQQIHWSVEDLQLLHCTHLEAVAASQRALTLASTSLSFSSVTASNPARCSSGSNPPLTR